MAEIFLVTGPMAAGKTTVAGLLARRFDRGVHHSRAASRESGGYGRWTVEDLHNGFATGRPRMGLWLDTSGQTPEETVEEILRQTSRGERAVAGADACPGGWAVAVWTTGGAVDLLRIASFEEALQLDVAAVGVDIPIGAPEIPPRAADREARRYVGPRASSVFPTPPRSVLDAPDYATALSRHRVLTGAGLSKQAFYLCHRMLEVEPYALTDERIVEVHPEVSFRELAGRPLAHPKKTTEGREERRDLLARAGIVLPPPPRGLPIVDALDAAVAAWTAARWARGGARPFPEGHEERIGAIWR